MKKNGVTFFRRPTKEKRTHWKFYGGAINCPNCDKKVYHTTDNGGGWKECYDCGVIIFVPPFSQMLAKVVKGMK